MDWPLAIALVLGLLGILLVAVAVTTRRGRGLGCGRTVALDDVTLFSGRLKLVGRPDRIVREGEHLIPEEWKSSKRESESHRLQLGAYFLLIEEEYGTRPPFGVVVLAGGKRARVRNTEKLRSKVLAIAQEIREHRRAIREEIPVCQPAAKCLAEHPHLEFYRLPSYSPQLDVIERFLKLLRRRATHNRLSGTLAELKRSLRASLCYYQTVRGRVRSLIAGCYTRPANQTVSPDA